MTATETLAHEAGHNAAAVFRHTKERSGNYEYHQTGLQSNEHTKTYPTQENTIKIINDEQNRENMKIL